MNYRADIDGLRAMAILPVMLFHAGVPGFQGGFVGVDVFFVISGYLITGLVRAEQERGTFSLAGFYERRIRRIFPALFAMLLVSSALAWMILPAAGLADFSRSAAWATVFLSNLHFAGDAGYFSQAAEYKPLLHTWSLAVEEQFYIVFPMVLLALRDRVRWLVTAVSLALLASLWAGVRWIPEDPGTFFYFTPFRVWELMLGALLALHAVPGLPSRRLREIFAITGLGLVAWSVACLSRDDAFPGLAALAPCGGAALLIVAGRDGGCATSRLLAARPMVAIGLASYSLYLWHWPLLVFARHGLQRELLAWETACVLALCVLVALASLRFVERPFRHRAQGGSDRPAVFRGAVLAMASVLLLSSWTLASGELRGARAVLPQANTRIPADYRSGACFLDETQDFSGWAGPDACAIGALAGKPVLLWGDSFAAHYAPGLIRSRELEKYRFVQFTAYACPPVIDARIPWAPRCRDINSRIESVLASQRFGYVVVAARWERYWPAHVDQENLASTLGMLKRHGLKVILVGQGPSFQFADPDQYASQTGRSSAVPTDNGTLNDKLRSLAGYDAFFDPHASLCMDGECPIREGAQLLYWDPGHYSEAGSLKATAGLLATLRAVSEGNGDIAPGPGRD